MHAPAVCLAAIRDNNHYLLFLETSVFILLSDKGPTSIRSKIYVSNFVIENAALEQWNSVCCRKVTFKKNY